MLIYEKKVDGVRHLFGTLSNVPADTDPQIIYKDADGNEITNITDFKLFYGTYRMMKASAQIIPTADDTAVNVYIGDTVVIGE